MAVQEWVWIGFHIFVFIMLALDLGVFHRQDHIVSFKEAMGWTAMWILLALAFAAGLYAWRGPEVGTAFLTGYIIEKSLSVDNIFVLLTIFSYFRTPPRYQHKILFWGILGALVMRAIFILVGVALIQKFHWVIYIFGAFLIYTAVKMVRYHGEESRPEQNSLIRLIRRFIPMIPGGGSWEVFCVAWRTSHGHTTAGDASGR
jgi:tellurite resistance protein TerC